MSLQDQINKYRWYHSIEIKPDLYTHSVVPHFKDMWNFNFNCLESINFKNKTVLDIGCRDGLFSFHAEKKGASEVVGIDNDLSSGAVEFLIPHFESSVKMKELNLYDLPNLYQGHFDIIMCFGVLYHLRYPFWGLKCILECLKNGGILLLETGLLAAPQFDQNEILYCPVENSPYLEPTSCTFFNRYGLETTLHSLRCRVDKFESYWPEGHTPPTTPSQVEVFYQDLKAAIRKLISCNQATPSTSLPVCRSFWTCTKDDSIGAKDIQITEMGEFSREWKESYWDSTHVEHSRKKP